MTFNAADTIGKIMHRVTSRILIGRELCRDESFLIISLDFTKSIFVSAMTLTMLPLGPFRRFASWIGSFPHRRRLGKALRLVVPIVEQCLATSSHKSSTRCQDALEWTIEVSESVPNENSPRRIACQLLHDLWAGSAAPGGVVTEMLFQILWEPRYWSPLQTECEKAVANHGWSEKALMNMPLLDSFIKEICRLHPTGSGQ